MSSLESVAKGDRRAGDIIARESQGLGRPVQCLIL